MSDMMTFPETWEEFEKSYGFTDNEEVYTNGSRLIPSFRVKQWLDYIAQHENKQQATVSSDCISRQDAINAFEPDHPVDWYTTQIIETLETLPSAEPVIIRCRDCKYRNTEECPMYYEEWVSRDYDGYIESDIVVHDRTLDEGFCDRGEREEQE